LADYYQLGSSLDCVDRFSNEKGKSFVIHLSDHLSILDAVILYRSMAIGILQIQERLIQAVGLAVSATVE